MTEVISKDEALKALEKRMEKQPMDDEYLFGVYNGLKCAKGIIEALPGATPQTVQSTVHAADRRMENMKRLTEYTIPEIGFSVISQEKYKRILMDEKPSVEKIYNRLTKIFPSGNYGIVGDIDDAVHRLAAIEDILGDEYELDRLRELVEADREGRCVILPCQIGATAYVITTQSDDFCGDRQVIVQAPFRLSLLDDIGKRVFLTHEEAEAALKAGKHTDAK